MSIVAASHNNDATDMSAPYTHRHQVYAADAAGGACQSLRSHSHSSSNVVQTTKRSDGHSKRQLNQYQLIGGKIGKGQHGHVRKAVYGSQTFAIKVVSRTPTKHKQLRGALNGPNNPLSRAREQSEHAPLVHKINSTENKIRKEIAIMKKCQHHHVVRIHEVIDDPLEKRIYLVLDYMGGGEIRWRQTVGNRTRPLLSLEQIRSIFRDVVLGLQYLHYQGIIHRDIKPANILWNEDRSSVKLGDLGSAHFSYALRLAEAGAAEAGLDEAPEDVLMDEGDLSKTAGSPAFFAPEICFQGDDYDGTVANYNLPPQYQITKAIDIWALGITLYCLLFGTSPYDDINNEYQLYQVIPKFSFALPPTMTVDNLVIANLPKDSLGAQSLNMLDRLLQKNPVNRATIDEIKRHPFVTAGMANPEGWIRDTNPARHALVEVTQQDTENTIVTRWNVRGMWRNLTHKRATAQPPSRQSSAGAMDTLVSPSNGALGRSRSEKSPHRQPKREITKESIHSHPPSGSGAKSAVELAGSTVEKPRPRLTSNSTSDSMRSRSLALSSGPPSRSASPARSGSGSRGIFSMFTNFALRRRPKSETTVGQIQGMAAASRSSTGGSSAGIIPVPHGEVDEPQCSPTSPGRESASDDDLGHPVSHTPVYDVYSGLRHRISAGSTISVSTHGSEFADTSFSARVLGAGGFPLDHNPHTVASPDGIESVAGSPPSGPSSFRTPPPIQHPSPRLATTPVQFTASARTESWDAEGTTTSKSRPIIAPVIPPRTLSSPLGRVTPKTLESDDSDDVDLLHPGPRPRGNSVPLSPPTPSGRNRYNENDDSDTDSGGGSDDEESDGANVLQMQMLRRPSMSAQTSPRDPGSPPSVNGSGAQSPLSSHPQRLIGLGVSAIAQQ